MTDRLDDLLNAPLAEPADSGFSAKAVARILAKEKRALWWESAGYGIAAAAVLAAVPFATVGEYVQRATFANSAPMMMVAALLALTAVLCRYAVKE